MKHHLLVAVILACLILVVVVSLGCSGSLISINTGREEDGELDPRIAQVLQQHEQQIRALSQQIEALRKQANPPPKIEPGKGFRESLEEKQKAEEAKKSAPPQDAIPKK
jgi:hypothetical protein